MSFEGLQERLTALQETTRQLQELISRLANLKFQPGSIPLDDEEGNVSTELSDEISDTLREQAEDLELLEQEVLDFPAGRKGSKRDQDKSYMLEIINKASRDLKAYVTS
jgi:protein transport protein SEC20